MSLWFSLIFKLKKGVPFNYKGTPFFVVFIVFVTNKDKRPPYECISIEQGLMCYSL